ncbi:FIMAH domain-containing protein [Gordoniibacillus kamchatkensis]|uniref:FIMAH domain-containing protein n=1 Tax=Gordoniibacillus kamchatkensis TaxID=1590651 RepID=UPI00373AEB01
MQAEAIGLGTHTVSFLIVDAAGNKTEQSFEFRIGTSFAALHSFIAQFGANGQFKNQGIQTSLDAKLSQAESQFQIGHSDQSLKHLGDLKKAVENGAAHGDISAQAANVLGINMDYLIANGLK